MSHKRYSRQIIYEAALALKNAIDCNPLSRASLKELLPGNKIGRNILIPVFKEITGHDNYRSYQRQKRMKAASEMLLSGMTVKETNIECGYNGRKANFARDFKLVFNTAPDEWQKQNTIINGNEHV
jgi:methylphosphotriester-DNA--protein-cysteine methyltransferase